MAEQYLIYIPICRLLETDYVDFRVSLLPEFAN